MRQLYMRDSGVVEAECLVTVLAIKVYVHVVIVVVIAPMAHTEFVFYVTIAVLNGVNKMMFTKKGKASRYTTLIDCEDSLFQFGH